MSYIRGKYAQAACGLLQDLRDKGIKCGPVAQPTKRDPVIVVYGMSEADIRNLPKEYAGFKVEGTTETPDYTRGRLNDIPHDVTTDVKGVGGPMV